MSAAPRHNEVEVDVEAFALGAMINTDIQHSKVDEVMAMATGMFDPSRREYSYVTNYICIYIYVCVCVVNVNACVNSDLGRACIHKAMATGMFDPSRREYSCVTNYIYIYIVCVVHVVNACINKYRCCECLHISRFGPCIYSRGVTCICVCFVLSYVHTYINMDMYRMLDVSGTHIHTYI